MTNKKTFFALILSAVMCVPFTMSAQVTIGSGRAPSEWSLLDLCTDVQRKALHNARMNEEQRDRLMSPNTNYHSLEEQRAAQGLLIFRTDAIRVSENPNEYIGCLEFWNGVRWVSLCENRQIPALATPHPAPATICHGDTHTFTLDAATGGSGAITYQWQSSTDGTTWTNITNAAGQNFTTPALTANTHFRRIATAANCGSSIESNGALVRVHPEFTTPHPANVTICHGARHTFTLAAAAGGSGTLTYQWQQSTDGGTTWTNITGATSANYTTPVLTANRHFRREARRTVCGGTITSNPALVTVTAAFTQPDFNPARYWTVQGARHNITLGAATGGSGNLTYQWQSSADGTNWTNIAGATAQNFHTPAFQAGSHRFFRRQATRATCGGTITSNTFEIVVVATANLLTPGALTANSFAAQPQHTGRLFQWGRATGWSATDPRTSVNPANAAWGAMITSPGGVTAAGYRWTAGGRVDPCPPGWNVPIRQDFDLIRDNTRVGTGNGTRRMTTVGGVQVWQFTNSQGVNLTIPIFPYARQAPGLDAAGQLSTTNGGAYWLANIRHSNSHLADAFSVRADGFGTTTYLTNRTGQGNPIRCVLR